MIGFFRQRHTLQVPLLLVLFVVFRLPHYNERVTDTGVRAGGYAEQWFYQSLLPALNGPALQLVALVYLLASVMLAAFVANQARLFTKAGVLPALCVFLMATMHPAITAPSVALLMLPLYMLYVYATLGLYATYKPVTTVVNMGFIAGIGFLLYHPFAWVALAGFLTMAVMRAFRIKEWLQYIGAVALPLYMWLALQYLTDRWQPLELQPRWGYAGWPTGWNSYWWLYTTALLVLLILGFIAWRHHLYRMVIQSRKNWYVLLLSGLALVPAVFWPETNMRQALLLLSFPIGMLVANIFAGEPALWKTLLFWAWLLIIAILSWASLQGMA